VIGVLRDLTVLAARLAARWLSWEAIFSRYRATNTRLGQLMTCIHLPGRAHANSAWNWVRR